MKKVRIGVFGLGRGGFAVRYCNIAKNAEVVAICDRLVDKLDRFRAEGIACFDNFDDFIQHVAYALAGSGRHQKNFSKIARKKIWCCDGRPS